MVKGNLQNGELASFFEEVKGFLISLSLNLNCLYMENLTLKLIHYQRKGSRLQKPHAVGMNRYFSACQEHISSIYEHIFHTGYRLHTDLF